MLSMPTTVGDEKIKTTMMTTRDEPHDQPRTCYPGQNKTLTLIQRTQMPLVVEKNERYLLSSTDVPKPMRFDPSPVSESRTTAIDFEMSLPHIDRWTSNRNARRCVRMCRIVSILATTALPLISVWLCPKGEAFSCSTTYGHVPTPLFYRCRGTQGRRACWSTPMIHGDPRRSRNNIAAPYTAAPRNINPNKSLPTSLALAAIPPDVAYYTLDMVHTTVTDIATKLLSVLVLPDYLELPTQPTLLEKFQEAATTSFPTFVENLDLQRELAWNTAVGEEAVNTLGRDVLVFLAATVVVVPLSRTLGVTPVLGFLIAGFVMGPQGLDFFDNSEADLELGDIGILFLLFSEGLNLSPDRLQKLGAFGLLGVLQLLATMALFFVGILAAGPLFVQYVGPVLQMDDSIATIFQSPSQAFCIAAGGALSSSAFVLPVLKERGWESRPEGIAALSVLLLQDLAVAPLLVIVPILAGSGPQTSGELGILFAKATVGFGAVLVLGSFLLRYVFEIVAAARSTETFVAAALLVALGMGQASDFLGLSATTGAFAAGVLLASNRYRAQIIADVRPFEGILLGIFFLTAGASLDLGVVLQDLPTLLIGIVVFIVIKAIVLFLAGPVLGKTRAQAARVAILLAGGGEFSLVLFKLAKDVELLPDQLFKFLSASVIISMSLTPFLGEFACRVGDYLASLEAEAELGDVSRVQPFARKEAVELFTRLDRAQSGKIKFDDLRTALVQLGLSYVGIAEIFVKFNTRNDGLILREEWDEAVEKGVLAQALTIGPPDSAAWQKERERRTQEATTASDAIVICGFTEFGRELYTILEAAGLARNGGLVAFDLNPSRVATGWTTGKNVIYGDCASPDLLRAAGVKKPRGVVVAFRSEAKRLDAIARLRDGLPEGTPIYARVISGQSVGQEELLRAGATAVVSERTEAAFQFGALLGAFVDGVNSDEFRHQIRQGLPASPSRFYDEEPIPGIPEDRVCDLAEEFGCTRDDLIGLYEVFSSIPDVTGDQFVPVKELGDVFLRADGEGPVDDDTLAKWVELADSERTGVLSFTDFARSYFRFKRGVAA
jgi:Kef-type K+ transport system membrane component KefB